MKVREKKLKTKKMKYERIRNFKFRKECNKK